MVRRRRVRFAAPLVIVTTASCGQPAPATLPTESPVAAAADAGVPIVDATPIDAEHAAIYVTVAIPAHTDAPTGGYVSCHDFGPHNRGCNPPRPSHYEAEDVMRRILDASANGDGSLVLVEQTDNAVIKTGMAVTAQTMTMSERTTVGYVREASDRTATLALQLSLDEVQRGADLVVDVTFDPDEAVVDSLDARIIDIHPRDGGGTILTVAAGRAKGVDKGWQLEVIGAKNGRGTITVVTNQASRALVKMTPDEVKQTRGVVRLTPPSR